MIRAIFYLLIVLCAFPTSAQVFPRPDGDRQRIQSITYSAGQQVVLTMMPDTPLTVVLAPGDTILNVEPGSEGGFTTRISAEQDSLTILPLSSEARSTLAVSTKQRAYQFILKVDYGPEAAVLVRYHYKEPIAASVERLRSTEIWRYDLRGDREVRPADITDDGTRTKIIYAPGQPLPAVFAIGPTGEEEVVNGFMRGDIFEIDRIYDELVFRIDKEKATARRGDEPERVE